MQMPAWIETGKIVTALVAAFIGAFIGTYLKLKVTNFVTAQDFDDLRLRTERLTETTQAVLNRFSRAEYYGRLEFEYRQKQLAEFYGPIFGRLEVSEELYKLWIDNKVEGINFQIKQRFQKQNEEIRDIITNKPHLIEGVGMPDDMKRFVTSTILFDDYAARTEGGELPKDVEALPEAKFPTEFAANIARTMQRLKEEMKDVYRQHGQPTAQG